jgi:NAD(P)-binding Rossmann-like domain
MHVTYDIIIVGGGIAGLYSAYRILKINPKKKILVLEKNSKERIGGRAGNEMFYGTPIATAAGIGRKKKDKLLLKLLHELNVPTREFPAGYSFSSKLERCNVKSIFNELKRTYNERKDRFKTFKDFAQPILGEKAYKLFLVNSGYTDYENADAFDTLHHYGFEDNYNKFIGVGISWTMLVDKLVSFIGKNKVIPNCDIVRITHENGTYSLLDSKHNQYSTEKVIISTTIDSVRKLLPSKPIYKGIQGQSFIRIYGKFSKYSTSIMKEYMSFEMVVDGPIYKIIPMNTDNGVYMIVYSDNKGAEYTKRFGENTPENRDKLCDLIEKAVGIQKGTLKLSAIRSFYWKIGTHYFTVLPNEFKTRQEFLREAQHPFPNMLVTGEMVALKQGWVEGALESVDLVVTPSFIS